MKHLNIYREFVNEGLITSMYGRKLVSILRKYIDPDYYVECPLGPYGECIDVRFNNKDRVYSDRIKSIIKISGWYPSKLNGAKFREDEEGVIGTVEFKPKFGFEIVNKIPKKLYHVSPTKYDEKILRQGLKPMSGGKVDDYPDRIYVSDKISILEPLAKELGRHSNDKEYTIWSIDTSKINTDFKLYVDSTVSYSHSFYIQGINISPEALIKRKIIKL